MYWYKKLIPALLFESICLTIDLAVVLIKFYVLSAVPVSSLCRKLVMSILRRKQMWLILV